MIDSQRGAQRRVGYNHLLSNEREWNNCFVKNSHENSLNPAGLVKNFPLDDFSYHICRAWYNDGSYTMDAKPIKSLELRYPMSQILIIRYSPRMHPKNTCILTQRIFACFLGKEGCENRILARMILHIKEPAT